MSKSPFAAREGLGELMQSPSGSGQSAAGKSIWSILDTNLHSFDC